LLLTYKGYGWNLDDVLIDPKKNKLITQRKNVLSSLKIKVLTTLQIKKNSFLLYFWKWKNYIFLYTIFWITLQCNLKYLFEGNAKQNAKRCKQRFFSFMEGYYNWNQQLSSKNKIHKYMSVRNKDSFLEKFQSKGSRERITNNQVVFVFFLTKKN